MTIIYDPESYRTLVSRPGEVPYKFWSVNKFVIDAAAAGFCTLEKTVDQPLSTTVLWLDLSNPEIDGGVVKAWNGASWVVLTKTLFFAHLGGGGALVWGSITGTLSAQTDLQAALDAKVTGSGTSSGTNTGDVTLAGAPNYLTISGQIITRALIDLASHVTGKLPLANMGDVGTGTVFYRKTAATGVPEVQTLATLKTDLGLAGTNSGDQPSIVGITGTIAQFNTAITDGDLATGGGTATGANTGDNAVNTLYSGLVSNATHTGEVTGSGALTITADAVTNVKLANVPTATFKGRTTAATGDPEDLTVAQAKTLLNLIGTNSGDQPSIVGITGTIAQFNTACTDADFATGGGTATGTNTGDRGVGIDTIWDAKGDLAAGTGADTAVRLAAGTNGQVLSANSATATGLEWIALAGGGDMVLAASQIVSGLKTYLGGTLGLRNVANTFTSFFTNTNTAARTYTLKDADGTVAFTSDIPVNFFATVTDGTTPANAAGADTLKMRAGTGLAVRTQNNDATHGDNALFEIAPRRSPISSTDFPAPVVGLLGPFSVSAIASGTFNVAVAAGVVDGNHPGVILFRSSTTANSGAIVNTLATSQLIAGGEQFDVVFRTPASLTALTLRFGYHDSVTSADAVDGIYFEMPASGAIVGKTSNNSVRTTSATIATLAINTWYHARLVVNANATGVDFFIFNDAGTQLGTVNVTTNIPTASGRECGVIFVGTSSGTTAVDIVNLDYMSSVMTGRFLQRGALTLT